MSRNFTLTSLQPQRRLTDKNLKVLSALPVVGHPRDSLRIDMLQEKGFDVEVVAFERNYHSGRLPSCSVKSLGVIDHGRYLARAVKMISAIPLLRRAISTTDLVYASGPDMALLCHVSGLGLGRPLVVEVGDIRGMQTAAGLLGWIVRAVEKRLVARCRLLVVTSPGFLEYYRKWLKSDTQALVLENKMEAAFAEKATRTIPVTTAGNPLEGRVLRIGYFGLLRDGWSWSVLHGLAVEHPDRFQVVAAGLPMGPLVDLADRVPRIPGLRYLGQYKSPDDLPTLYNAVDMVWACYPPIEDEDWNLRWARPNRFYQSCFFRKPIFTRAGCQDAVDVEAYKIGKIIGEDDVAEVIRVVSEITAEEIRTWTANIADLPRTVYTYTSEGEELRDALCRILDHRAVRTADYRRSVSTSHQRQQHQSS